MRNTSEVSVIRNFRDDWIENIFDGEDSRKARQNLPPELHAIATRKLQLIHIVGSINDLRIPPSNRLEALKGKRADEFSIRINSQWRIVFRYNSESNEFYDVGIEDYH